MTTEDRKIQLSTSVDATGATQGFEKVKQGARDMALSVSQSGETAGNGLDKVGDGSKRAADNMARETGKMRGLLQKATVDFQTIGKSLSEKFEARIELKGAGRCQARTLR